MLFTKSKGTIYSNTSYSGADMFVSVSIAGNNNFPGGSYVVGELQTLSYSLHMERGAVRSCGNINVKDYTDGPRTIAGTLVFAVFDKHFVRNISKATGIDKLTETLLADELPPFDVTITYSNEYGHRSVMRIYGVRLVNEGMVMSINDILTENTYQYLAKNISPINTVDDLYDTAQPEPEEAPEKIDEEIKYENTNATTAPIIDAYVSKKASQQKDGMVCINIKNPLEKNNVVIYKNIAEFKRYTVLSKDVPFYAQLPAGIYKIAMLDDKSASVGNVISVEVLSEEVIVLNAPLLQYTTQSIIGGMVLDKEAYKIICFNNEESYEQILLSPEFCFTNLKPDTAYTLYTLTNDNQRSPSLLVVTNVNAQERLLKWKDFVLSNNSNVKKEHIDFFTESFEKILILAKETSYAKSLTYYYYTLKSTLTKNTAEYIACDYFVKEANIYELKDLFASLNYSISTDNYYNNQLKISKNTNQLLVTNNEKTIQINMSALNDKGSYYLYSLPNSNGIYLIKQRIDNKIEQQIEYYVAEDFTRTEQTANNSNKEKTFSAQLDRYYNENINLLKDIPRTDDSVIQSAFNQNVFNIITCIYIKEQTEDYVVIEKTNEIEEDCYIIFCTYKDIIQNSFVNKIFFDKSLSELKVYFKELILNEKGTYFVYLSDNSSNTLTNAILLKIKDSNTLDETQKTLFLNALDKKYISSTLKAHVQEVMENEYINSIEILEDTKKLILSLKPSSQRDGDLFNILNLIAQSNTSNIFNTTSSDFLLLFNKDNTVTIKVNGAADRMIYGYFDVDFKSIQQEKISLKDNCYTFSLPEEGYYICLTLIDKKMQSQLILVNAKTKQYFY